MDLKTYLSENSVDVQKLAERLDVSKEAIRLWASGKRMPRPDAMRRILEETKGTVTPNDFVGGVEPPVATIPSEGGA